MIKTNHTRNIFTVTQKFLLGICFHSYLSSCCAEQLDEFSSLQVVETKRCFSIFLFLFFSNKPWCGIITSQSKNNQASRYAFSGNQVRTNGILVEVFVWFQCLQEEKYKLLLSIIPSWMKMSRIELAFCCLSSWGLSSFQIRIHSYEPQQTSVTLAKVLFPKKSHNESKGFNRVL